MDQQTKGKVEGKGNYTFPLRDIRDDDRPYDYIFAKFSTNENIILSITYEFRLVNTNRSIQEGLKAFNGSISRSRRFENNDAFLFDNGDGVTLISSSFLTGEYDGILQTSKRLS